MQPATASTLADTPSPPLAALTPAALCVAPLIQAIDQQLHPDTDEFVGRAFLRDVITIFLTSRNRMLALVGPPGVGKTALAVQLVRERLADPQPYLAHFCSLPDGDSPVRFCLGLAEQLKACLGDEYRPGGALGRQLNVAVNVDVGQAAGDTRVVGVEIRELKLGDVHPREAFRALVREPLQAYHAKFGRPPGGAPLMIVIDALDRVWQWDGGQSANIVSVLADVQDLPPWVNFICMARPGPAIQALRAQAGVRVWDIDASGADNLRDVEAFLRERFLGQLDPPARARLDAALAGSDLKEAQPSPADELVRRVVAASEGNFSYVRRYVGAWRLALSPGAGQPALDPASLLRFDGATLDAALRASYAAVERQVRPALDASQADADDDVLTTLALAFEPLTLSMLARLSEWRGTQEDLAASLGRLAPVLEVSRLGADPAYAFYHRGFAEYMRQTLPMGGRARDLRLARLLEQAGDDARVQEYGARHRWDHLLRGLDLSATIRAADDAPGALAVPGAPDLPLDWRDGVERVREIVPDPLTQAQLLRLLAARALDPAAEHVDGSWSAALSCLRTASRTLRRSRAVLRLERRGWRRDGQALPPEVAELEQTLIALGDAYRVIAQRMDSGGRQYDDWIAERRGLYLVWDASVRLPLTLYLLLTLVTQGVREIHIPGALENLGRGQDWTIARLYVLSVSAYRRARALVQRRGDEDLEDDISERLARTYFMMGAFDAAASTYEALLSRPAALSSPWRRAIWQHALADVLLARRQPDRAAELLGEALLVFKGQQAPVLQARALGSLAMAQARQAEGADLRGEGARSLDLDDQALNSCDEALVAWRDVTRLEGDEGASVDPVLAISGVGNLLWKLGRSERLSDEQARRAQTLRASIASRIFPQRFEHPLLRLFRVLATVLLPATLLLLLLVLVQSPNTFSIPTRTEPALQPPLVNLSLFPNDLISGSAVQPGALTDSDVTELIARAGWRQFAPAPPRIASGTFNLAVLRSLGLFGLLVLLSYLGVYALVGLLILQVASPAHHQSRRPGRIVLERDALIWEGEPPLGIWRDTLRWLRRDLEASVRRLWRELLQLFGGTLPAPARQSQATRMVVPLSAIARVVTLDRRERGRLLGDFSLVQLVVEKALPGESPRQQIVSILGSLVFYDELCDELSRRLGARAHRLNVELFRSLSGVIFFGTLAYTALLALLALLAADWLSLPIPALNYSLSDLYVLVAPGFLLPLLWWFVAQPLAARAVRGNAGPALAAAAVFGGALAAALLQGSTSYNLLYLQPDLFTPTLAVGVLAALALNAPRPLVQVLRGWRGPLSLVVALGALVGAALLGLQLASSLAWYNELVQGSLKIRSGLRSPDCARGMSCPEFEQAVGHYTSMICLQPGASKGYAFRGLARVAQGDYTGAGDDFADALQAAEGHPPASQPRCSPPIVERLLETDLAALHGNLGATRALAARVETDLEAADPLYQDALLHFAQAISYIERSQGTRGPATQLVEFLPPPAPLRCADLARQLIPPSGVLPAGHADYMLQIADACYSRGFNLARTEDIRFGERRAVRQAAWADLTAAVDQYTAVANSLPQTSARISAERGRAAAWFILGQIDELPADAPTSRTYLLRALNTYRDLEQSDVRDETIYAGHAWSAILLDAWSDAHTPLARAVESDPQNPTYPALQGLVAWLDSTRHPLPRPSEPSPGYTRAISDALALYTRSIELSAPPRSEAFATRSVLYYSLRNSPRGLEYAEADYGFWMRQALSDIDQAIILAEREGRPPADTVGYRYWRGRLSFSLALTWQRRLRGLHSWNELVPLYSRALDDYSAAAAADPQPTRRREYANLRIPWARLMLNNAVHMQLAEQALRAQNYATARSELELVSATLTPDQRRSWDPLSEPRPEFSLLYGLASLALEQPADFINPHTGQSAAEASFAQLVADADRSEIVDPALRAEFYRRALAELDALVAGGRLSPAMQLAAGRARATLSEAAARAIEP